MDDENCKHKYKIDYKNGNFCPCCKQILTMTADPTNREESDSSSEEESNSEGEESLDKELDKVYEEISHGIIGTSDGKRKVDGVTIGSTPVKKSKH